MSLTQSSWMPPQARFSGQRGAEDVRMRAGGRLTDLRWAWRNLRARGWRPVLAVTLLAIALAANTLVFSAADSLVFNRTPYRDVDRLVEIRQVDARTGQPGSNFLTAPLL